MNVIVILGLIILIVCLIPIILIPTANLNKIKSHKTGDGQYGTADWASKHELQKNLEIVEFDPESWRQGKNLPKKQGVIVGAFKSNKKIYVYVDTSDNHTMVVSSPGGGKTTTFLYPNIEYSAACNMSGFITDTKGNVFKDFYNILTKYYHCKCHVIDLRYPLKSTPYNLLSVVNKYMDLYKKTNKVEYLALAEGHAKTIANAIIHIGGFKDAGANQYFHSSAEGVIAGMILLVSQYCNTSQRHIISVFKLIRECVEKDPHATKDNSSGIYLDRIYKMLPKDDTIKSLLAPVVTSEFKTAASIISTAMSQLLKFIDKEMEQLLCFDNDINYDEMANGRTFIFFVIDEKAENKNFMVNLIVKQLYGELLKKAEEYDDICLPSRIIQWLDEFGTYAKIDGAEGMFSAGRSRNIISVPFLQSLSQLSKNYGKDIADTIKNSCQNLLFSYQSPTSDDAEFFSKKLGNKTVTSGSVTSSSNGGHNSSSKTLSMTHKPILSADEITKLNKGEWIFMKAGMNPSHMNFYINKEYNQKFDDPFFMNDRSSKLVTYADKETLTKNIAKTHGSIPMQNAQHIRPFKRNHALS